MIKWIVLDIDGVLTDGSVYINENGNEVKRISYKNIDAVFEMKRKGYVLIAITGEHSLFTHIIEKRFPWDHFFYDIKDKSKKFKELEEACGVVKAETCFIGDGKYDVTLLKTIGFGITPDNAIPEAKLAANHVLKNTAENGCLWEALEVLDDYNAGNNKHAYFLKRLEEHIELFNRIKMDSSFMNRIIKLGNQVYACLNNKGKVFLAGNGGSAADAQHIAAEFISRFKKERRALNFEALTTNTSILTAIANDYDYEFIFARQIEAKVSANDILICLSTSGESKNIIAAAKKAKECDVITVMFTGDKALDKKIADIFDYVINIPSDNTPRIQEAHILVGHILAEYVEDKVYSEEK